MWLSHVCHMTCRRSTSEKELSGCTLTTSTTRWSANWLTAILRASSASWMRSVYVQGRRMTRWGEGRWRGGEEREGIRRGRRGEGGGSDEEREVRRGGGERDERWCGEESGEEKGVMRYVRRRKSEEEREVMRYIRKEEEKWRREGSDERWREGSDEGKGEEGWWCESGSDSESVRTKCKEWQGEWLQHTRQQCTQSRPALSCMVACYCTEHHCSQPCTPLVPCSASWSTWTRCTRLTSTTPPTPRAPRSSQEGSSLGWEREGL